MTPGLAMRIFLFLASGMVENPPLQASPGVWSYGRVPSYRSGPHSKRDLKVQFVWAPKYRKPVLVRPVAFRVRDLLHEISMNLS